MRSKTWFTIVVCCLGVLLTRGIAKADDHEFRYKAPGATSVELMCENNGWKSVAMTKGDDGVWTAKVTLAPGTYAYKFLVDGKDWVFDPDNSNKKTVDGTNRPSRSSNGLIRSAPIGRLLPIVRRSGGSLNSPISE